jgi:hypothetical protein
MSQENVATARSLYPGAGDLVAAFADLKLLQRFRGLIHPDFEAVFEARSIPMGPASIGETGQPTLRGFDALVTAWREWLSAWETWFVTPTEFVDVDEERVLVLMDVRARSKTHRVEMPLEGANLLTIRDGRLVRLEMFLDEDEAREAAGLSK